MRKTVKIGAGLTSAAIVASMAAGVVSASASGQHSAAAATTAISAASHHVTRAQARHLARGAVPHSRVIEVESEDLHHRVVWKVQLTTPHGRVVVDVDKRSGKVTILEHRRSGHDDGQNRNRGHDGDGDG